MNALLPQRYCNIAIAAGRRRARGVIRELEIARTRVLQYCNIAILQYPERESRDGLRSKKPANSQ
jgi:hypothetical protein